MRFLRDNFFASVRQLIGARAITIALQILSLPILARLLSIEDFAIASLGMAIPLFANTLSDAGFGRSLIRTPRYDDTEWSSVFWFLAALGVVLGLLVVLIAPFYARAMNHQELVSVVIVLAIIPTFQSLMSVHQASIERAFRFDVMSGVLAVAGIISVGAALGLAFLGFGYWALVIQQVLLVSVRLIGVFWLSNFRPKLVFRLSMLKPHVKFGTNTLLFSGVMTLQNQAPVIAFNQMFGTLAVSLWSMTERVARLPRLGLIGPLSQVAMVSMSRQWRDGAGAAEVGQSYISATRLFATLMFPGMLVLAWNGRPVFTFILSEPWGDIALIFGLAAPGFLIDMVTSFGARVFMVADRTDLRLRMAIERCILGLTVFFAALPFGLEAAILVRSSFAIMYLPRYWNYMNRCVPLSVRAEVSPLIIPAGTGLIFGALGPFITAPLSPSYAVQTFVVLCLCIFASALAAIFTWNSLKADVVWLRKSAQNPDDQLL